MGKNHIYEQSLSAITILRDASLKKIINPVLKKLDIEKTSFKQGIDVVQAVSERSFDLILTEAVFPDMTGLDILKIVRQVDTYLPVILFSAKPNINEAVDAIRSGAENYFHKPWEPEKIRWALERALRTRTLYKKNIYLEEVLSNRYHFDRIVAASGRMQDVLEIVKRVAPTTATVLIEGESGTGKELIARAIHFNSPRTDNKMVKVNSAAIPEALLESELFGHERGSFTGAIQRKLGKFELANRGTLFLDEISELPLPLQAKLLRAIQEREIERIGGTKKIKVDIRLVAATNNNLDELVRTGLFREDLFHRLNVVPVRIPPLRKRPEDIPELVEYFLKQNSKQLKNIHVKRISSQVMNIFLKYPWRGNIRELENIIERLCILTRDEVIYPADLPPRFIEDAAMAGKPGPGPSKFKPLDIVISNHVDKVLNAVNGNKTKAADILGISLRGLHNHIKKLIKPAR